MAMLGRAFIEVRADLSQFPEELRGKLKAALAEGAAGAEFTEVEHAARKAGERAGEELSKGVDDSARKHMHTAGLNAATDFANSFTATLGSMLTSQATMWTGLIAAVGTAIGDVLPAAITLAGLAPSAVAGLIASAGTLKLAFHGVGDAISAAFSGDAGKLNDALKGLTPAAQSFVREIAALRPQLQGLQHDVQQAFFVQLEGSLTRVVRNLLPSLRSGLTSLAAGFGQIGRQIAASLSGSTARGALDSMFVSLHRVVVALAPALGHLTTALLNLVSAGAPVLGQLGVQLAGVVDKFSQWITQLSNSGALSEFFQTSLGLISQLGSILGNVVGLVSQVLQGLSAGGPQFIGVLGTIVKLLENLFNSDQGSELLATLGELLTTLGTIVAQVLGPLLPAVAHLADAFGQQLEGALVALTPSLVQLSNLLIPLINFVADHADVFGPIAAALLVLAGANKVFDLLVPAVTAATAAFVDFDVAADANPVGAITLAIEALIAGIVLLVLNWKTVKQWGVDAWNAIKGAAKAVWDWLQGVGSAIGDWFSGIGEWFQALPGRIGDWLSELPGRLADVFVNAIKFLAQALGFAFGFIVGEFFLLPGQIVNALSSLGDMLAGLFRDAWAWVTREVALGYHNTLAFFNALPGQVWGFLMSLPGIIAGAFRSAWEAGKRAVSDGIDAVVGFFHALPGRIGGFLDNVGHTILGGLKSGINGIIDSFNHGIDQASGFLHISLPHLPHFAQGGIVTGPTLAVLGEKEAEVVLPTGDPARAQELLEQSGLAGRMAAGASQVTNVNVTAVLGTGEILRVLDQRVELKMGRQVDRLAGGLRSV